MFSLRNKKIIFELSSIPPSYLELWSHLEDHLLQTTLLKHQMGKEVKTAHEARQNKRRAKRPALSQQMAARYAKLCTEVESLLEAVRHGSLMFLQ